MSDSGTNPHPAKRARTNDSNAPSAPLPPKRETLLLERGDPWFEDGSIILQAGNKQFLTFRSLLMVSSPVFKDMFNLAQPGDTKRRDKPPVVILHDDPEDVSHLLKAICDAR